MTTIEATAARRFEKIGDGIAQILFDIADAAADAAAGGGVPEEGA